MVWETCWPRWTRCLLPLEDPSKQILLLHAPLVPRRRGHTVAVFVAAATTLAVAAATGVGLPLPWAVLLTCVPVAVLVGIGVLDQHRRAPAVAGVSRGR